MEIIGRTFFIILLLIGACNPVSKEGITKPISNPKRFQDGGILMLLPGTFVRKTFEEVQDSLLRQGSEGPAFIFHDSINSRNTFSFSEAAYLDVEEGAEDKMFSEFQSVMIEDCKKTGATCKLVENDMFELSNGYKVFKMSYLVDKEYNTTYFIASETRIVKVTVRNVADDGEATVRSMNIDRYFYVDPLPAD